MDRHVALFRAVNVGGQGKLRMVDLRDALVEGGVQNPRTLLQTGNVVFASAEAGAGLELKIEAILADRLSLRSDVLVRRREEWDRILQANPFPKMATDDPSHLLLMVLKNEPDPRTVEELKAAIKGPEIVEAVGRQLYIAYLDGIGRSKLTGALIERRLGTRGTGRNWNTVLKIAAELNAGA